MSFNIQTFKKTYKLFTPYILNNRDSRKRFFVAFLLILMDIAVASIIPYISKLIIDSFDDHPLASSLSALAVLLGFFWILEKTLSHIQDILFFPVVNHVIRDLTFDVVKHIHHIPMSNYQALSIPEIINCTRRISQSARSFIKIFFLLIIPTSIKLIITTIITIKLGLFGFALLPALLLSGIILYQGTKWYVTIRESAWQISDQVINRINDSILNTKIARFNPQETQDIHHILSKEAQLWHSHNTRLHLIHIAIAVLLGITVTGIFVGALIAIQNQHLTIGDFVLLKGQLLAAFLPFKTLSMEFRQLAESTIDIKKIRQLFDILPENYKKDIQDWKEPKTNVEKNNGIFLENVIFYHLPENIIFKHLCLEIPIGIKIGIIGESGSGKSSLLGIIASLYKPSGGHVFLLEENVLTIEKERLHKMIHFIPQDLRLFNMSLRDNILYGIPQPESVSNKVLLNIAAQVDLLNLIQQLPKGLDTSVGEMGANLSGGEKQKVALARALLLKPTFLLLDETTHSLDIESENFVLQNVFLQIPTVIIVSHKASTLQHVDTIFKIDDGKLHKIENNFKHYLSKNIAHA